ncbi:MAG: lipoyl synthase [Candidatus Omnitrophica bacterium CG1_02_49_16]|nr:MAG: lipoyl synthase [Candidatus Omnitrophica bacterium CG1_02_49_16]
MRKDLSRGQEAARTDVLLKSLGLHTICESGRCPNRDECYSQKTATFMIMGDRCTRSCGFCSVSTGHPEVLDPEEPRRVAEAVAGLGLKHVVVTSVTRDDLQDEGASQYLDVLRQIRSITAGIIIEILTPDFRRTQRLAVRLILRGQPNIFNHNIETVPRLYRRVRPQGNYERSLQIFREIKTYREPVLTKSGLMLGLGETHEEVIQVLKDLRNAGCRMLTLGQYLKSSASGLPVEAYIHPEVFLNYKNEAMNIGFTCVESAPYVRSSFHAKESYETLRSSLATRQIQPMERN